MKVGAIAYRATSRGIEICLVSSRRHKGKLTLPKGEVMEGETLVAAVKREWFEEAGLHGKVKQTSRPLCFAARSRQRDPVFYFLVKITDVKTKWPEKPERNRIFTTLADMTGLPLGDAPKALLRHIRRLPLFADHQAIEDVSSDDVSSDDVSGDDRAANDLMALSGSGFRRSFPSWRRRA